MKHLKFLVILVFVIFTSQVALSQHHRHPHPECKQHREHIKAERVAYITKQLDLSVKEAQKFWPVYNEYQKNIETVRDEKHTILFNMSGEKMKLITEKEAQDLLNKYFATTEKEHKLKKAYHQDLSKILSAKKIYLLYNSEKAFKRKLVKELRGRKPACMKN
jgi:hypothetical protein